MSWLQIALIVIMTLAALAGAAWLVSAALADLTEVP